MDPGCQSFGSPEFFGVEFYLQQECSVIYEKLCPAPVTPAFLIKESKSSPRRKGELAYTRDSHHFLTGIGFSLVFGALAFVRMARCFALPEKFRVYVTASLQAAAVGGYVRGCLPGILCHSTTWVPCVVHPVCSLTSANRRTNPAA